MFPAGLSALLVMDMLGLRGPDNPIQRLKATYHIDRRAPIVAL